MPLECALQEAAWNPYYALLLARLAAAATSHAVTLQYCLWDQFKAGALLDIPSFPPSPRPQHLYSRARATSGPARR